MTPTKTRIRSPNMLIYIYVRF